MAVSPFSKSHCPVENGGANVVLCRHREGKSKVLGWDNSTHDKDILQLFFNAKCRERQRDLISSTTSGPAASAPFASPLQHLKDPAGAFF
jgi:hypothetical protein